MPPEFAAFLIVIGVLVVGFFSLVIFVMSRTRRRGALPPPDYDRSVPQRDVRSAGDAASLFVVQQMHDEHLRRHLAGHDPAGAAPPPFPDGSPHRHFGQSWHGAPHENRFSSPDFPEGPMSSPSGGSDHSGGPTSQPSSDGGGGGGGGGGGND